MHINVLYEDNHLLVVEKPVNIAVMEDQSKDNDFLNILKSDLKVRYQKPGNVYLALVHRLDRPVGGIMVFAKTSKAASRLSQQVANRSMAKTYHAVINGEISQQNGRLEDYLLKNKKTNMVSVVNAHTKDAKLAQLDYSVKDYKENLTLVKVHLITGRSHQIRVQFASRNHPLWGDQRYNPSARTGQQIALFASSLSFNHPITGKRLTFELPLPNRFPYTLFN